MSNRLLAREFDSLRTSCMSLSSPTSRYFQARVPRAALKATPVRPPPESDFQSHIVHGCFVRDLD
eukprot:518799-Prorocentrum_minimum.AAC.2